MALELVDRGSSMKTYEIATERKLNVLVLGVEKKNLVAPGESIKNRNFEIFFEGYKSHRRLQEFDGVIVFQGIFEKFERHSGYEGSYTIHGSDTDELDKRKKGGAITSGERWLYLFSCNRSIRGYG